ncbi:MAG TPA: hypothetical protein ENI57_04565, partial [Ignavibacteria bacterium]|nr:hypothetical protein [Ignavibacteria bacterium]
MRKLYVFSLSFMFFISLYAQEKQNQNVELPDFVITGKNVVNMQSVNKKAPPVLEIISKNFLQPVYSTENLKVVNIKSKTINPFTFKKKAEVFNGGAILKGGIYSIPQGSLFLSKPFSNGIFQFNIDGANMRAHVKNSDYTSVNGSAGLTFFVKNNSDILPGTKISFKGSYGTRKYKFYATANPSKRTLNKGRVSLTIQNLLSKYFVFNAEVSNDFHQLKDENFKENLLSINGFAKISLAKFDVASNIIYKKQILTNNLNSNSKRQPNYLFVNPRANLNFIDNFKVSLGFTYSHVTGNNYYAPYASVSIGLGSSVTLVGEYSPKADLITQGMLIDKNKYFDTSFFTNLFFKKTNSINISLKYEYLKFFEMDLGFNYYSSPNQPYYGINYEILVLRLASRFDLLTASAKSYSGYVKLLLNPGDYGLLTAILKYHSLKDDLGKTIPYNPLFNIYIKYLFNYNENISIEPSVKYNSSTYADLANRVEINSFIDLSIKISKRVNNNLELFLEGT